MTSAAPEPREEVRGRGTLERDMKINQRLPSIGSPQCQITEQKPLCFVLTVRYARHTPLDTRPLLARRSNEHAKSRTTKPACQSHQDETDRTIVFELYSTGHFKQQYKQEGMNSSCVTFVNCTVHS